MLYVQQQYFLHAYNSMLWCIVSSKWFNALIVNPRSQPNLMQLLMEINAVMLYDIVETMWQRKHNIIKSKGAQNISVYFFFFGPAV